MHDVKLKGLKIRKADEEEKAEDMDSVGESH